MSRRTFDPNYEFQAPQFYDFGAQNSGEGDSFFEKLGENTLKTPAKPDAGPEEKTDPFPVVIVAPVAQKRLLSTSSIQKGPALTKSKIVSRSLSLPKSNVVSKGSNVATGNIVQKGSVLATSTIPSKGPVLATASTAKKRSVLAMSSVASKVTISATSNQAVRSATLKKDMGPAKPEVMKLKPPPVPYRPFARNPSPTVGVKKCKPVSPTKPNGFSFKTDQRALVSRKRELFPSNSSRVGQNSALGSAMSIDAASKSKTCSTTVSMSTISKVGSVDNVHAGARPKFTQGRSGFIGRRSASAGDIMEKKPPTFKARPMPAMNVVKLPPKRAVPVTQSRPFNLSTGRVCQQQQKGPVGKDQEKQRPKTATCVGRPITAAKIGDKRSAETGFAGLHTERRAEKRKAYDDLLKKREEEQKEKLEIEEKEQRRVDEEEIRKLRKALVHRPVPIMTAKPMEVKRGIISTTKPETPKFLIEQRLKERSLRQQNQPICKL